MNKEVGRGQPSCFSRRVGKRGWLRILEATIAVLIVSGSLFVVYSRQVDRGVAPAEYFSSLEGQILADISERSDLRLNVLNVENDNLDYSDSNFSVLNEFVKEKIPEAFGYSLQICDLNDNNDRCNMDPPTFIATRDKDIFTEEIMISAELGDGSDPVYKPKKVKLYIWEGDVEIGCAAKCNFNEDKCVDGLRYQRCVYDDENCLVWGEAMECPVEYNYICKNDDCVPGFASLAASYSGLRTEVISGITYVRYYLSISEIGGGLYVDLESRQRCWLDETCDSLVYDAVAKFGTDRIDADGSLSTIEKRWFRTSHYPDRMTETWEGVDELGNPIEVSYSIDIPSENSAN